MLVAEFGNLTSAGVLGCGIPAARTKAPFRRLSQGALYHLVSTRLDALGIHVPRRGPHSLRHACAGRLVAEGFSLKEIGDHLGHRCAYATRIYAKVDLMGPHGGYMVGRASPYAVILKPQPGRPRITKQETMRRAMSARLASESFSRALYPGGSPGWPCPPLSGQPGRATRFWHFAVSRSAPRSPSRTRRRIVASCVSASLVALFGLLLAGPAAGQYAEVHGLRMYFEVHGEGRPVVLLHGV
jgi:hypothetical protein